MSILNNEELWKNTLLVITYDEHGGIYDHVEPPACTPDEFTDPQTGFKFDRLGIRVPTIFVSPWIPEGTVIDRTFDHASIPATVTKRFIGDFAERSPRELAADTFLDVLTLNQPRTDYIGFQAGGGSRCGCSRNARKRAWHATHYQASASKRGKAEAGALAVTAGPRDGYAGGGAYAATFSEDEHRRGEDHNREAGQRVYRAGDVEAPPDYSRGRPLTRSEQSCGRQ